MEITNSVAFVTGGNRGIGEAFVRAFVAAGARRVYVGTRLRDGAAHLVKEAPDRIVAVELDVSDEASIKRGASRDGSELLRPARDVPRVRAGPGARSAECNRECIVRGRAGRGADHGR